MSWTVYVRMVKKDNEDGTCHVVLDDWYDELKWLCSGSGPIDETICEFSTASKLGMPDDARALFEITHRKDEVHPGGLEWSEKWHYYTKKDCEKILERMEQEYQRWFLRLSKIKEYMDTTEYMKLTQEQKDSVREELNEATEMFDSDSFGARYKYQAACFLYGFWLTHDAYLDDNRTWMGLRVE